MGTLICRVELNKTTGITVKVENQEGKITQTIVMDGTSIITTCKGNAQTSTITQKEDSIVIQCKDFKVEAETIYCKSTKTTKHESLDTMDILSTKDMTLKSSAKLTETATSDVSVSGANITEKADSKVSLSGINIDIKGTAEIKAAGAQIKIRSEERRGGKECRSRW